MKKTIVKLSVIVSILALILVAVSCTTPVVTQNPDGSSSTNHVVDPRLTSGIEVGRAANAASAPFNPFAYLTEIGLSAVAVGAGWVAKRKNDKAAANALLLKTVVQAIDALDDTKTKEAIEAHAVKVGVESKLNTTVKQIGAGLI